jgi:hypothetical protein
MPLRQEGFNMTAENDLIVEEQVPFLAQFEDTAPVPPLGTTSMQSDDTGTYNPSTEDNDT